MTRDEQWLLEEKYAGHETEEYETDKKRLASGEPLGYTIGWQPFLGLKIHLDSHPLIPRVETEWWTERLLDMLGFVNPTSDVGFTKPNILDLCAGSGAIGCAALARLPDAHVYFGEIDLAHEATILKNIRDNNLDESRAEVRIGDLFEPFAGMQFDLIATNPPYIPAGRELPASVTGHEPSIALFAGDDGLAIIRRIAIDLHNHISPGGQAWIECDSAHAAAACALFTDHGLVADIRTDQYGQPRVIRVEKRVGSMR
ncbi:MAG: methyltransferase [Candidatus Paceibacterota bacterium]|jgi:release factor glutamine methyltransferase